MNWTEAAAAMRGLRVPIVAKLFNVTVVEDVVYSNIVSEVCVWEFRTRKSWARTILWIRSPSHLPTLPRSVLVRVHSTVSVLRVRACAIPNFQVLRVSSTMENQLRT